MKDEDAAERVQVWKDKNKQTKAKKKTEICDAVHSQAFLVTSEQPVVSALLQSSASPHEMPPLKETHHMVALPGLRFHDDRKF